MEIFIENQLKNIGYSIILGLIFGAFYDIISILHIIIGVVSDSGDKTRRTDLPARIIFFVIDLLYMAAVTAMISVFLYEFASGDLRVYLLAAAAAGFTVYRYTLGKLVSAVSEAIVRMLRTVIRAVVIRPIRLVMGWIQNILSWIYRRTIQILIVAIRQWMQEKRLEYAKKRLAREIRLEQR